MKWHAEVFFMLIFRLKIHLQIDISIDRRHCNISYQHKLRE